MKKCVELFLHRWRLACRCSGRGMFASSTVSWWTTLSEPSSSSGHSFLYHGGPHDMTFQLMTRSSRKGSLPVPENVTQFPKNVICFPENVIWIPKNVTRISENVLGNRITIFGNWVTF